MRRNFPKYGFIGLVLVVTSWILNWSLDGLRTHILFFPLWFGYCILIDALVLTRKGSSMLTRDMKKFFLLFVISIPVWWLFELINFRTQNWYYYGKEYFTDLEYYLLASLSFSTVIPAVFGTAELVGTFNRVNTFKVSLKIPVTRNRVSAYFAAGWVMLGLLIIMPEYFFVFVWISLYFILEPLNIWLKNSSLLYYYERGDYRILISLWTGVLLCGFFWELWNYLSFPKWIYRVPLVDFLHIFEMPLIGYLGYLPFSLELIAFYYFVNGSGEKLMGKDFLQIAPN